MAFLSGILAFFMSIFSIFGGIFGFFGGGEPVDPVDPGNGFVGGDTDTSRTYYRPVIVKTDKGTWYEYNPSDGILVISCDYLGETKYEANLSDYLKGCTERELYVSEDGTQIVAHFVYRTGAEKTLFFPVDYTQMRGPGE